MRSETKRSLLLYTSVLYSVLFSIILQGITIFWLQQ